ncbi:MAG: glycosyltransferase [Prevotella conceptionensis]|jgi:hypothetical protein|uniref:glycosyltransferase n=1 Tax=Prevotella conceptionensis TaxID=340486 RepID=UPI00031F34FD|nr:glycosyltransferase [Prevotella conceptionensis]
MKALTIIIPFANEAGLLRMTVENIFSTIDPHHTDILLIDDASNDQYDYQKIAEEYGARYYKNDYRKGIARCREIGIALSNTRFFLLLDGHMKAITKDWDKRLIEYGLKMGKKLCCCQTASIDRHGNLITERQKSFGAYINLPDMLVNWNYIDFHPEVSVEVIPCVLGGAYFCSRSFWQEFGGLCGLNGYGFDEQVMSMRAWRHQGKCILIKDICFGHYYRDLSDTPYEINKLDYTKNKFVATQLFENIYDLYQLNETYNLMDYCDSLKEFYSINRFFAHKNTLTL